MFRVFIVGLCASALFGQLRVSASQQGAEFLKAVAGRKLKGIGIGAVDVCQLGGVPRTLDSGLIYSELRKLGIATLSPIEAGPLLDRSVATSGPQVALDIGTGVSSGVGLAGVTKTLKMSNGWQVGLTAAPILLTLGRMIFSKRLANDSPVKDNLLRGTFSLSTGSCIPDGRLFLFRYHGDWDPKEVVVP